MSALKAQGIWPCDVLSATAGEDDKGAINVQINVRISDGPDKGQLCTYEDTINNKSALYIARSCKAVGWNGGNVNTLAADVQKWIAATGGKSTVEIKHIEIKNGKRAGQIWDKPNSIGRGPRVLKAPTDENLTDANDAMRAALEADGGGAVDDENIPFASCDINHEPTAIARVLRGAL